MPAETYVTGRVSQDKEAVRGSQTKRDKLVLQEWGFCGWAGNPPKENKALISKDAKPWISTDQISNATLPEHVKQSNPRMMMMMMMIKFAEVFISLLQNVFVLMKIVI
jgi:uncharacterized Fe-S cluster protein YjdI